MSQILSTDRRKKKGKKKGRRRQAPAKASKQSGDLVLVADLLKAKQLAEQLGGVEKAQQALRALSKLQT